MTKSECYAEISRCTTIIGQDQQMIAQLNTDISELRTTETKVDGLRSVLSNCKSSSSTKLGNTGSYTRINSKIVSKIFNNMNELFEGAGYQGSYNGLGTALNVIGTEINNKIRQIDNLNAEISSCQGQINNMNETIARIEAEEAAERARAEAARREAEARAAAAAAAASKPVATAKATTVRTTTTKTTTTKTTTTKKTSSSKKKKK